MSLSPQFDTPAHVALWLVFVAATLAMAIDIARSPRAEWKSDAHRLATAVVLLLPVLRLDGIPLPLGAIVWFAWLRRATIWGHQPTWTRGEVEPF